REQWLEDFNPNRPFAYRALHGATNPIRSGLELANAPASLNNAAEAVSSSASRLNSAMNPEHFQSNLAHGIAGGDTNQLWQRGADGRLYPTREYMQRGNAP